MAADYPGDGEIHRIENWNGDWNGLLKFMESIWPSYGVVRVKKKTIKDFEKPRRTETRWEFVTGGWSGCEQIINAFYSNHLANAMLWESTHRGGLHVLKEVNSND